MKTQTVPINEVKSNPNNPRIIKDDKFKKLVASIKELPQMLELRPIIVNEDMIVLGGNMRLKACKEAGLKEIPIIKASELNEEQQRAFIIKDNVGFGEWDWDALANEWDAEQLEEWGLDVPNMDAGEMDDLSEQIQPSFRIEVLCKDEEHQEKTYNKLIADGLECKLLTL
ncbi:ParB/Sulfiredoxin [uncultured Caudovirales phage]|uniref:ParB/Sulfiredoxin n=1 Tax=uncultured Caudovirales phage TaxID=2100421 RepID=A0A6J5MRS6_9CAUD|nr:ParB/Sulfiredoxin [uncultured Caudovirales phage]